MRAPKPDHAFRWAFAASLAAALVVISPFFVLGQASGHDFQFHVASWVDVVQQWRAGILFPSWAVWANHGYGEPRFLFYPPLSWSLGGALGLLLPWSAVPGTFIVLCILLSAFSMFRLARLWLPREGAVASALLYAVNPYLLVLTYVRSDFAELLAASLFPLAMHYALCCDAPDDERPAERRRRGLRNVALLALVYGAIWLANAPAAVVASYALAFLLFARAILRRSFRPLLLGFPALGLGLLLAGVYVVPAAYEQAWVNIGQINSAGFLPAENFLFTRILDPEHNLVNLQISTVAVLIIVLTGIAAAVSHRRAKIPRAVWTAIFSSATLSVFLMFPASGALWRHVPELRFLQFPWRWLLVLAVSFAFFLGEMIATSRRRLIFALACAALLGATGYFMTRITYWDSDDLDDIVAAVSNGQGYDGAHEYCPFACDPARLAPNPRLVALTPGETQAARDTAVEPASKPPATLTVQAWLPEYKAFTVDGSAPLRAAVRLLYYPAWSVRINGAPVAAEAAPGTAQMRVPLSAGRSFVEIRFTRTADRTIGGALTALAALVIGGLLSGGRRRSKTGAG